VESTARSIAKAVSYRLLGSATTAAIVFFFNGDAKIAAGAGMVDLVAKLGLYFLHERIWNFIPFGRNKLASPEYEI
jgi:uncharacterized membrane protein